MNVNSEGSGLHVKGNFQKAEISFKKLSEKRYGVEMLNGGVADSSVFTTSSYKAMFIWLNKDLSLKYLLLYGHFFSEALYNIIAMDKSISLLILDTTQIKTSTE